MKKAFGVTGSDRKELVRAVSRTLGIEERYLGAPTMAYQIGEYTVSRYGDLEGPDGQETEELLGWLADEGFRPSQILSDAEEGDGATEMDGEEERTVGGQADTPAERDNGPEADQETETSPERDIPDTTEEDDEEPEEEPEAEEPEVEEPEVDSPEGPDTLTIEMPRGFFTGASLEGLEKIIASKGSLIKKALGTDDLRFSVTDEIVRFPWFHLEDPGDAAAYSQFIHRLSAVAKESRRVIAKDRPVESEKFAFRIFLVNKLGMKGPEFKAARKLLLRNLDGPAAFPNQEAAERHSMKLKEAKKVEREAALQVGQEAVQQEDQAIVRPDGQEADQTVA